MADEFISFDKVLRELQMQEEELKRLVSEGEIRAFRDQDKMKFKKEDIERFRKARPSDKDATVSKDVPEELVFDEDDANQEVGMATAAIQDDSFLEEEAAPAPAAKPAARATRASASGGARKRVVVEDGEKTEGAMWKVAMVLASIVLLIGLFVAVDASLGHSTSNFTKSIADMFAPKK